MPKNAPFSYFSPFLIDSLTFFINKPDSSRDSISFIISSISSFEIINVVVPDPKVLFWIAASFAAAAGIKTSLAHF